MLLVSARTRHGPPERSSHLQTSAYEECWHFSYELLYDGAASSTPPTFCLIEDTRVWTHSLLELTAGCFVPSFSFGWSASYLLIFHVLLSVVILMHI